MRVKTSELREGDEHFGVFVDRVYRDAEGTWVDWSDGDCGYVQDSAVWTIERLVNE